MNDLSNSELNPKENLDNDISDELELKDIENIEDDEEISYVIKRHKKHDYDAAFLTTQVVLCSLALVVVFVIKLMGGNAYNEIRANYVERFDYNISVDDVFSTTSSGLSVSSTTEQNSENAVDTTTSSESTSSAVTSGKAEDSVLTSTAATQTKAVAKVIDITTKQTVLRKPAISVVDIKWPVTGEITSPFGYRVDPISKKYALHQGVDIACTLGEPVHAALDGIVKAAGVSSDYGNYVLIDHGNGLETLYGHNSALKVKAGDTVCQGDVISLAGSTGMSTGPHCHFEVRIDGTRINPQWVLPPMSI